MKIAERQRRHDELFQKEVADGLGRILSVLHDISDGIREFQRTTTSAPEVVLTDTPAVHQKLLSVKDLAEMLGTSTGFVYGLRASGNGPVATKVQRPAPVPAWRRRRLGFTLKGLPSHRSRGARAEAIGAQPPPRDWWVDPRSCALRQP